MGFLIVFIGAGIGGAFRHGVNLPAPLGRISFSYGRRAAFSLEFPRESSRSGQRGTTFQRTAAARQPFGANHHHSSGQDQPCPDENGDVRQVAPDEIAE